MHARHILVVDDNEIARMVLATFLRDEGHDVIEGADGAQAVRLAQQHQLDLILMDIQMPLMDGVAATRAIRAMPVHANVPIVAFTGFPKGLGADAELFAQVLVKPMSPEEVIEAITPLLPQVSAGSV